MATASEAPTLPARPASVLHELSPGLLVAERYLLEEPLGRGAMGVVFAARDVARDEPVALKFLILDDDAHHFRSRFAREARICAKLTSEHVVKVLDFGAFRESLAFIAMERLEGSDLRAILREKGPLLLDEAVAVVVQICEGLAEVHAKGVVHRDLKPSNVFRTHEGVIKILDFGISKSASQELTLETELTDTGAVLGTPRYMAPEQLFGGEVDARADVWSVGAILYELLTGRAPFEASTLPLLCARLAVDDPPTAPSALRPELPRAVDAVVLACFARSAAQRTPNVAELAGDLLAAIGAPNAEEVRDRLLARLSAVRAVRVTTAPKRRRGPVVVLVCGALLAAVVPILLRRAVTTVVASEAQPTASAPPFTPETPIGSALPTTAVGSAAPTNAVGSAAPTTGAGSAAPTSAIASAVATTTIASTPTSTSTPKSALARPTPKPPAGSAKPSLSTLIEDRQ